MPATHQLEPGRSIRLDEMTTKGKDFCDDRDRAEAEFHSLRQELAELQYRFYADGSHKLLIILQAIDAGGKDGTIRHVFDGVNPQGVRVWSFKAPSKNEQARDYLWRVHRRVPADGMIGVFNRSHYEDVLVVRVEQLVPESTWRPRYEQINQFEKMLCENGTTILKFYLHISAKEQKERFEERLSDPAKNWKFSIDDLRKREQWDAYMEAFEEMLNRCTTPWAPWHVIPANQKWYRNLAITKTIVETIRQLNPQFPPAEKGIENIRID